MNFADFLKSNNLDDSIQATAETAYFLNKNGKKFVLHLSDLKSCLYVIWVRGFELEKLFEEDWKYEENKFRSALGNILQDLELNSVASMLGSQTPSVVRSLELYAYFMLSKSPSKSLSSPNILKTENLSVIFSDDLRIPFQIWLQKNTDLTDSSLDKYILALSGALSRMGNVPIFSISDDEKFKETILIIRGTETFKERDSVGKGMYGSALTHYLNFLQARPKGALKNTPPEQLLTAFRNALHKVGLVTGDV